MHLYNIYFYDVPDKADFGKDAVNHTYPGLVSPWAPSRRTDVNLNLINRNAASKKPLFLSSVKMQTVPRSSV